MNILPSYKQNAISRQLCTWDRQRGQRGAVALCQACCHQQKLYVGIRVGGTDVDAPIEEL